MSQLDTADLQEPSDALAAKTAHLKDKLAKLASEMDRLKAIERAMLASPDQQISLTDPDSRSMATSGRGSGVVGYNVQFMTCSPWLPARQSGALQNQDANRCPARYNSRAALPPIRAA